MERWHPRSNSKKIKTPLTTHRLRFMINVGGGVLFELFGFSEQLRYLISHQDLENIGDNMFDAPLMIYTIKGRSSDVYLNNFRAH